jgi:hypothetical protein
MKILPKALLACVLSLSLVTYGCSTAQFFTVLDQVAPAVLNVLQIVTIFTGHPANTALSTKVSADVAATEKLYSDYTSASSAAQPGIKNDINAAFVVLNSDLGVIFSAAQVSDHNTQLKIAALIGLIQTSVSIAEAIIPSPTPAATLSSKLDADTLVASYNKILTAPTGNKAVDKYTRTHQLHIHSKLARVATAGILK